MSGVGERDVPRGPSAWLIQGLPDDGMALARWPADPRDDVAPHLPGWMPLPAGHEAEGWVSLCFGSPNLPRQAMLPRLACINRLGTPLAHTGVLAQAEAFVDAMGTPCLNHPAAVRAAAPAHWARLGEAGRAVKPEVGREGGGGPAHAADGGDADVVDTDGSGHGVPGVRVPRQVMLRARRVADLRAAVAGAGLRFPLEMRRVGPSLLMPAALVHDDGDWEATHGLGWAGHRVWLRERPAGRERHAALVGGTVVAMAAPGEDAGDAAAAPDAVALGRLGALDAALGLDVLGLSWCELPDGAWALWGVDPGLTHWVAAGRPWSGALDDALRALCREPTRWKAAQEPVPRVPPGAPPEGDAMAAQATAAAASAVTTAGEAS